MKVDLSWMDLAKKWLLMCSTHFAPGIDYSTVCLLINTAATAFENRWNMYHWDIPVAFTSTDSQEQTYDFNRIFLITFVLDKQGVLELE